MHQPMHDTMPKYKQASIVHWCLGRASPGVFELVQIVGKHGLLPVVVHEGISLSDTVELLKAPHEQLDKTGTGSAARRPHGLG